MGICEGCGVFIIDLEEFGDFCYECRELTCGQFDIIECSPRCEECERLKHESINYHSNSYRSNSRNNLVSSEEVGRNSRISRAYQRIGSAIINFVIWVAPKERVIKKKMKDSP